MTRRHIQIRGIVQGVGFRPFVWRLAHELGCTGFVCNDSHGVSIEVQGLDSTIEIFLRRLVSELPTSAAIQELTATSRDPVAMEQSFSIIHSMLSDRPIAWVAPDIAPCSDCLAELLDPNDRRFAYPFVNCTNCGPRFTIIETLPYDRQRTTMHRFKLCDACQIEYDSPADRRFHAEPNACPVCGPRIWFSDRNASLESISAPPKATFCLEEERRRTLLLIAMVQSRIRSGQIIAIKGIGGFHLACDATSIEAVRRLRHRKNRPDKPFAVMVADLETCDQFTSMSEEERVLLTSRQRPIVLLRKKFDHSWFESVAPGNPALGVMLPNSPLHHLLVRPGQIWVMTSGNLSDEPISFENQEAWHRLSNIADGFLFHDRPISVPCDDSVVLQTTSRLLPIRRSRGYAPLPISMAKREHFGATSTKEEQEKEVVLAVGGEIKSTICLSVSSHAFISQHIGDLSNVETLQMLERMVDHFTRLYQVHPHVIAADLHPGYHSVQWAEQQAKAWSLPLFKIQHHHAHAASLMAEHNIPTDRRIIACVFDGTGYGPDGTIWGGEWLIADFEGFRRYAHLNTVPLPGGDACILRPARSALAHLFRYGIPWTSALPSVQSLTPAQQRLLHQQLEKEIHTVETSSMGRLFDAVAALVGLRQEIHYEGEAAMQLEYLARNAMATHDNSYHAYPFQWIQGTAWHLNCKEMLEGILDDSLAGIDAGVMGARFHETIADASLAICLKAREETEINVVGLTGGVFQNELLTRLLSSKLQSDGFEVLCHQLVPPNDAGIALGQAVVARERWRTNSLKSQ